MNTTFKLSELSADMLLRAYTYYNRGRFWKYNFDEWLLKEFTPVRNAEGKLINLYRKFNGKYGYETDYIGSYSYESSFVELYNKALK